MAIEIMEIIEKSQRRSKEVCIELFRKQNAQRTRPIDMGVFNNDEIYFGWFKSDKLVVNDSYELGRMSQLVEGYAIDINAYSIDKLTENLEENSPEWAAEILRLYITCVFHEMRHVWQAEIQSQQHKSDWRSAYYKEDKTSGGYENNRFEKGAYAFQRNAQIVIDEFVKDGKLIGA